MEALQGEDCFLKTFVHGDRETAHPLPTKALLKPHPDTDILFASFRYTHPAPPVFALAEPTPKNIARSDIKS